MYQCTFPEPEHPEDLVPAEMRHLHLYYHHPFKTPRKRALRSRALSAEMRDVSSILHHSTIPIRDRHQFCETPRPTKAAIESDYSLVDTIGSPEIEILRGDDDRLRNGQHEGHYQQRQAADDLAVQHIMRTQALEAGARVDTLEDTGSSS
ncbi:hypothetical protein Tco_0266072 [Tanacetum coccineum]